MQISDVPNEATGQLRITGPLGVEWQVEDARFQIIGTGVVPVDLELSAGLYTVIWSAAGRSEQRLVRVLGNQSVEEWGGEFPFGSAPPSSVENASELEKSQFVAVTELVERPAPASESEIMVVVRSSDRRPTSDLGRSIRVYNNDGVAMRSKTRGKKWKSQTPQQLAVRNYHLPAGNYTLKYEASDRRVLEQSVFAFPGRRTIVFLKYGTSIIARKKSAGARFRRRRGVDPVHTTIVSTDVSSQGDIEQTTRLADILLHKLATRQPTIESAIIDLIYGAGDDPYLRLYGAALLLNISPGEAGAEKRLGGSAKAAVRILDDLSADCPDVVCLSAAAAACLHQHVAPWVGKLPVPPMLDISWRWAAALSVSSPLLAENPIFATISRVTQPTMPWLTWPARAPVEERLEHAVPRTSERVEGLISSLAEKAASLGTTKESSDSEKRQANLSTATVEFANAALSVASSDTRSSIAEQVAFSTGTSLDTLAEQLEDALSEISEQIDSSS